ncbi:rRNA adenine N-6-methyltransferase family protein [Micromonospora zamorensis]|uniref:rRNA adenine N-6-methyltransferase family protein n=1 Tax=Micromonospora zamorensis TaxID=709883 RepID=UPI003D966B68
MDQADEQRLAARRADPGGHHRPTRVRSGAPVDAAILRIRRREEPLVPDRLLDDYREMVDIGFTGLGGSLVASLKRHVPGRRLDAASRAAGIDPSALVGSVRPDQWISLYRQLAM